MLGNPEIPGGFDRIAKAIGDLLMNIEFLCVAGHELSPFAVIKPGLSLPDGDRRGRNK
jgi:hypothetical protein